ncbi:MAG TPA: gliding motility-associated ABC transporter substrate-binding protein GldG [Chitinophagaceae bacterium]|nr:gliding motility-associated ABC transporter substrate-binding protein GldG [Chitinophagaceae bacterium]
MKKLLSSKYWWIVLLALLVLVNIAASFFSLRADLTAEKRYTLSDPTRRMLAGLDSQVNITVFLEGDMPKDFKKLQNSSNRLLQEFKEIGKSKIKYVFEKPGAGLNDSAKAYFLDSIAGLGIKPYTIQAQVKEGEGTEQRQVVPGALVSYKGRVAAVDLLAGQSSALDEASINRVEATLEYKFASAVQKIITDTLPVVGYLLGNGETFSDRIKDLINNNIRKKYGFAFLPIDSVPVIPHVFNALLINKPTQPFSDEQKLKLDQFAMRGGKILWMIDNLYAEMDSLQRSQNEFIAFDRGLQLEDLLFKYGVRINLDLVQDLNCDKIPSVVGNIGGKPQIQLLPWPYSPLLQGNNNHPITKNLDYVLAQFPNSIDTVKAEGIQKTILLSTGDASRILSTPAKVSWNSIQNEEDIKTFNKSAIPIAVLLEGQFTSLYANRLSTAMKQSLDAAQQPFVARNEQPGKMIVVSDGDIALNFVSSSEGALAMGVNPYTKAKYANSEFVMNCVEYLVDQSGILATRNKDIALRLLDKKKLETDTFKWQLINVLLPLLLVVLLGGSYQYLRKRKYAKAAA